MRISTSMLYNNLLNGINNQQNIQNKGNANIASGTRFQTPAQAGVDYKTSLDLRHSQLNVQSSIDAVAEVESRLGMSQTMLNDMKNVMQRAETLAVQQASAQLSNAERQAALQEMIHLSDQLLADSNQQWQGQSLFAGTAVDRDAFISNPLNVGAGIYAAGANTSITAVAQTANPAAVNDAYTVTLDAAGTSIASITNGVGANLLPSPVALTAGSNLVSLSNSVELTISYNGTPDTVNQAGGSLAVSGATAASITYDGSNQDRIVSVSATQQVVSNIRGDNAAFGAAFSAMLGFQTALQINDLAAIQTSLGALNAAGSGMIDLTAEAGAKFKAVQISKVSYQDMKLNLDQRLNTHEAVDIPATVAELQQSSIALQAAYSQVAQIKSLSLINFLR